MRQQDGLNPATAAESVAESNHMDLPTPPPSNKPKLFAGYKSKMSVTPGTTESVADVLGRYLSDELDIDTSCLRPTFWREHPKYGRLTLGALRALSVPASSAPMERVFSYGGIFMRPHGPECQKQHRQHWCFLNATACKLTKLF